MHLMEGLACGAIERLAQQDKFLRRMHQAELAKDPLSLATASSRSNIMAVQHTVEQIAALLRARAQ